MTASNCVVLSSDHAAIQLRQAIAAHIATHGWVVVDIGPTSPESTHYPKHGEILSMAKQRRGSSPLAIAGLASSYAAPAKAS